MFEYQYLWSLPSCSKTWDSEGWYLSMCPGWWHSTSPGCIKCGDMWQYLGSKRLSPTTEQSRHLWMLKTTWTGGPIWSRNSFSVSLTSSSDLTLNILRDVSSLRTPLCAGLRVGSVRNLYPVIREGGRIFLNGNVEGFRHLWWILRFKPKEN